VKDLLATLAEELVDDPAGVSVRSRERDGVLELEVSVAPEDRGRIIGQRGRTVTALRAFLEAVAARQGRRCTLEVR
jgi:hypothetical protein